MQNNTNETNPTPNPYQRQRGFFGSLKDLGTTSIKSTNVVLDDAFGVTTDITGATRTVSSVAKSAVGIWGTNLLADLASDSEIDSVHREIQMLHQKSELDGLKAELAKMKAQ